MPFFISCLSHKPHFPACLPKASCDQCTRPPARGSLLAVPSHGISPAQRQRRTDRPSITSPSPLLLPIRGSEGTRLKQSPPPPYPSSPHIGPKSPICLRVLRLSEGGGRKQEIRGLQLLTGSRETLLGGVTIQNGLHEVPPNLSPTLATGAAVAWQGWESRRAGESYFILFSYMPYSSIFTYSHHQSSTHHSSTHHPAWHHRKGPLPEDPESR